MTVDYEQATHWIERSVKQILEDTHYEGGKMVEDQTGASGATVTPLRNYRMLGHNAAPDIQLMTLENLRVHSKTQLNRADFEAAYKAVKGAYDAERAEKHLSEVQPDHNYVYNYQKADGLKGGGAYAFDPKQDKAITLSGNVFLKKSALTDKGLVHGRDYEYAKDPYGS
ncbi:MAG: hypothetical protein EBU84_21125, partial [Actinobacteria bacterium]|nr:hypothetical protein [Actinomycetota bacterium]